METKKPSLLRRVMKIVGIAVAAMLALMYVRGGRTNDDDEWGHPPKQGGGPRVGIVDVRGVITDPMAFEKRMHALRIDPEISAILVRIDSPGGAVAPSQEMAEAVRRAKKDKKVVCSMGTVAASGGYYIASQCDEIFASKGTITASIGVISESPKLQNVLALLRVEMEVYKSGGMKDAGSPFRATTPEERTYFEKFVQGIYEQFVTDVADGRKGKITMEKLRPIADGRVLTGVEAVEAGLVDTIGNFEAALDRAGALSGKAGAAVPVFPPEGKGALLQRFLGKAATDVGQGLAVGVREEAGLRQRVEARDARF